MHIHTKFSALLVSALLGSATLSGAQAQEVNPPSQAQVEMISGGIGETGMDHINDVQKDYNLKLVFASPEGEYLADVNVIIRDKKGNLLLEAHSLGPILLVKLEPGKYTVSSGTKAETKTNKFTVSKTALSTHYIHLNDSES